MQLFRERRARGRPPHPDVLTPAEWRVLEYVRAGHSNPEIAEHLGIALPTVKMHVSKMLAKLHVTDRRALAKWEGEPLDASRTALARFSLAVPIGWVRDVVTSSWIAKAAGAGAVAVISVIGIVALSSALQNATGGGGAPTPAPTPSAGSSPPGESVEHLHTGDIDTDIPEADIVANQVLQGSAADVINRLRFFAVECVEEAESIGHPPLCEDGEPPGTPVDVFSVAGEVPWQRDPAPIVREVVDTTIGLYGLAHGPATSPPNPLTPQAEYVLIFTREVPGYGECGYSLDLADGDIVSLFMGNGCIEPDAFLDRYGERLYLILPPPGP